MGCAGSMDTDLSFHTIRHWTGRRLPNSPVVTGCNGSATAKAIDYSQKRWVALIHYLHDGQVPIDNNWIPSPI